MIARFRLLSKENGGLVMRLKKVVLQKVQGLRTEVSR